MLSSLSRWSRPFSALFALWFAMVLGDPGVLHSCPMHGGAHAAAAAHASHAGSAHHGSAPAKDASGQCSCVGECCAVTAIAAVSPAATFVQAVVVARPAAPPAQPRDDVPSSADVRLPFANGPPLA